MKKLTSKTIDKVKELRRQFPKEISVSVRRVEDGGYCAEVTTYKGCFTEADTFSGLIEMVNDAVRTYIGIPEMYFSYMPEYLPPIDLSQRFNVFPPIAKRIAVDFNINEKVKC
jgi:predicted RNase H-like HicB family nuclease